MRKFATSFALIATLMATPMTVNAEEFIAAQKQGEWIASNLIGEPVKNAAGETVGDVNDLLFTKDGNISAVIVGVGGFLGIGEKDVAIALADTTMKPGPEGGAVITVKAAKAALEKAPEFKQLGNRTGGVYEKMKRTASDAGKAVKDTMNDAKETTGKMAEGDKKPADKK